MVFFLHYLPIYICIYTVHLFHWSFILSLVYAFHFLASITFMQQFSTRVSSHFWISAPPSPLLVPFACPLYSVNQSPDNVLFLYVIGSIFIPSCKQNVSFKYCFYEEIYIAYLCSNTLPIKHSPKSLEHFMSRLVMLLHRLAE